MNDKITALVKQIKQQLIALYGEKIEKVILYSSQARNEATKESDIDILVIVDESLNPSEVRRNLSDLLYDILLKNNELISVIMLPKRFYHNYHSLFMLNVKKEGIPA